MISHPSGIFIGKTYKLKENPYKQWGITHKRIQEELMKLEVKELELT